MIHAIGPSGVSLHAYRATVQPSCHCRTSSNHTRAYELQRVLPCPQHHQDSVSERLRRWTRNPLGSARRGSNPLAVEILALKRLLQPCQRMGESQCKQSMSSRDRSGLSRTKAGLRGIANGPLLLSQLPQPPQTASSPFEHSGEAPMAPLILLQRCEEAPVAKVPTTNDLLAMCTLKTVCPSG